MENLSSSKENPSVEGSEKKPAAFFAYFSAFLSLAIVAAGIIWVAYGDLPAQYYLPVSAAVLCIFAVLAYVILSRSINFS